MGDVVAPLWRASIDETDRPGTLRLSAKGTPESRRTHAGTLCVIARSGEAKTAQARDLPCFDLGPQERFRFDDASGRSLVGGDSLSSPAKIRTPLFEAASHLSHRHPCSWRPTGEPLALSSTPITLRIYGLLHSVCSRSLFLLDRTKESVASSPPRRTTGQATASNVDQQLVYGFQGPMGCCLLLIRSNNHIISRPMSLIHRNKVG
ncbi:hypothetical protein BDW02DRAFT_361505 [Decorospora gaudefroyi]|uniref:Uncharacterized protein n=1 Tax=Decorospora gaudefroyi TaxID=184978 RepID=A0A6A5KDU9_9PLEO|nr:hypothetical protein BDW02DRAFT_361505 [Decorospora gaudefroyi]